MMKKLFILIILLLPSFAYAAFGVDYSKVEVVSDVSEYKAGEPFKIAVKFNIDKDWHIYWRYPGEFGIPTKFSVEATDGVDVGEFKFPAPETFKQLDNKLGYGYSNEVVFLADVTPSKNLLSDIDIKLKIKLLYCSKTQCLPNKKELLISLPKSENSNLINQKEFKEYEKKLPLDIDDYNSGVRLVNVKKTERKVEAGFEWQQEPSNLKVFIAPKKAKVLKQNDSFNGLVSNHSFDLSNESSGHILLSYDVEGKPKSVEIAY